MTRVEVLEKKIAGLPPAELAAFRRWFVQFDAHAWDRQIEDDVVAGRLAALADAGLEDFRASKCTEL